MIDHVWSLVCRRSVVDSESNNMSIYDVVEQINILAEPRSGMVVQTELSVVTMWTRTEPGTPAVGRYRITFLFPSGKLTNIGEFAVDLSEHARSRTVMKLLAFPASESGRHVFCVEFQGEGEGEWHRVAKVPVEVVFQPQEAAEKADEQR